MNNFIKNRSGFTMQEILTACAIVLLIAVFTIPVIVRVIDNIKDQAILATLWGLFDAQKSYRDSQTPTTYANDIELLMEDATRYGYSFRIALATADRFRIEARKERSAICQTIDERGRIGTTCTQDRDICLVNCDGGGEPPGGGGCFLAGTPILMASGKTLPIEQVKVGDEIIAFDEASKTFQKDTVKELLVHPIGEHNADHYLIVNGHLKVTPNHPVYTDGKWRHIGNLGVGDNLFNAEGNLEPIRSIQIVDEHVKVYNLEINPFHTYIAGGIVVHNGEECGGMPCGK